MLLDNLPLSPGAGPPRGNGPLVKPKGDNDRLQGTAVRQEREHESDGFGWRPQAVECRAFCGTERLVTRRAEKALVLARVDANVALAGLASGGACQIRAECALWGPCVYPPSRVGERTQRKYAWTPIFMASTPYHG